MHPEVQELQPKLKEILYDCAVEIRATKAALFLYDGSSRFELVTEYGFRSGIRQSVDRHDPIVDRCGRGRSAFFINGLGADPRFSEVLYEASTDRLLAAPIYSRGQLVGLIDMRDKAARQPFENADLPRAQRIAERMNELFASKNVFSQRYIALSSTDDVQPVAAPTPRPRPPTPPPGAPSPPAPPLAATPHRLSLATLILHARAAARGVIVAQQPESLTEHELAAVRDGLRSILLIPGAAIVMFSVLAHEKGVQEIAARTTLGDDAAAFVQAKLKAWLTKRGEHQGRAATNVQTPFGTKEPPITAGQLKKVFTAPVTAGSLHSLYLTVAFTAAPDRTAHELLATMLGQLQTTIESSMHRDALHALHARIAEKLLEPDFTAYPALRAHSDRVVARAEELARHLAMSQGEIDQVRLVARVHDAGMRLLDYDRLYRKPDVAGEEMGVLREHPIVGAAMVEPLLGNEIARAVLCHHERWDGRGYPNELHGEEIPRLARVVQVCDVYETMIAPDNVYQPAVPPEKALAMIAANAGTQFDAEMVRRFVEMMR